MLFEPRSSDFPVSDLEAALLRAAVGDYATEAAVLLLMNSGHWVEQLRAADLLTVEVEDASGPSPGSGLGSPGPALGWAAVNWPAVEAGVLSGRVGGSSGQLRVLRVAASLADGQPVDLADVTSGLDREQLRLVLAALSHAGGSHEHRQVQDGPPGHGPVVGDPLPPLVRWPPRP